MSKDSCCILIVEGKAGTLMMTLNVMGMIVPRCLGTLSTRQKTVLQYFLLSAPSISHKTSFIFHSWTKYFITCFLLHVPIEIFHIHPSSSCQLYFLIMRDEGS